MPSIGDIHREMSKKYIIEDLDLYSYDDSEDYKPFSIFTDEFKKMIQLIYVTGYMGTGKTHLSIYFADYFLEAGIVDTIITNIKFKDKGEFVKNYVFIQNNKELEKVLNRDNKKKMFILDEAGINIDSRSHQRRENKYFTYSARLTRKRNCHFMVISQEIMDIDVKIRKLVSIHINKTHKTTALVKFLKIRKKQIIMEDIPPTRTKFDTNDIAEFHFVKDEKDDKSQYDKKLLVLKYISDVIVCCILVFLHIF